MIKEVDFEASIQDSFLEYAKSVAQERSIIDVRDGLKYGLRQGLYAQYSNKLTSDKPYKKALKSVAAATSQSYVHGDAAIYDTFVRAAKPWAYRYLLEDAQGSVGSPCAPDDHTASRYLELRASELANYLFDGLKKNAVGDEWYDNYDNSERIPSVFPSIGFWNIVNGCTGIAVSMSTSIPTFNLREVNGALIKLIKNPNVSFDEIYCPPDFPTGGTITNAKEVKESLRVGKGKSIRMRADLQYSAKDNCIIASHLPYSVYTNTVIGQLAELTAENENYGIERIIDHTKKEADIRIYLSRGANPAMMIQKLYKDTSLESWYGINMIMLDHGRFPKVFGWKEACQAYIEHCRTCQRNILQYDLDGLLARNHILNGLLIAIAHIEEVIKTIKESKDGAAAKVSLMKQFNFTEPQAEAILNMKLQRLANLEGFKIEKERNENDVKIDELRSILNTPEKIDEIIIGKLTEVMNKFGDARRTRLSNTIESDDVPEEGEIDVLISVSARGMKLAKKEGKDVIRTTSRGKIIIISNDGRLFRIPVSDIVASQEVLFSSYTGTKAPVALVCDELAASGNKYVLYRTKEGIVKKNAISDIIDFTRQGSRATKLREGDTIIRCGLAASDDGTFEDFFVSTIKLTSKTAIGEKKIRSEK